MSNNPKSPKPLDRTDRHILECLQADGRMSNVALAKKVNLSITPCLQRVRRLEREGYIVRRPGRGTYAALPMKTMCRAVKGEGKVYQRGVDGLRLGQ